MKIAVFTLVFSVISGCSSVPSADYIVADRNTWNAFAPVVARDTQGGAHQATSDAYFGWKLRLEAAERAANIAPVVPATQP